VCLQGWTALTGAATGGHTDIVMALIEAGADKEATDNVRPSYLLIGLLLEHLHWHTVACTFLPLNHHAHALRMHTA
jgi:hypothetical protein